MAKKGKTHRADQFYARMEQLLGRSEARQLMDALQEKSPKSVRYNRKQISLHELNGSPVPWCRSYGRYWKESTLPSRSLEYAAGYYYIQEASAMLAISAASRVIDFSDKIVLDLTAAPGGKATQAAELIDSGYLVANEVIKKRVHALTWNVNRLRLNNVIVTSIPTRALAEAMPGFFDVVVVDAPCSGEGLFTRQKHSLEKWSQKNVRICAARQTSILKDAVALVRPGGFLVYATCTFAPEENEHQVEKLLAGQFLPVPLPGDLPVSPAVSGNEKVLRCSRRIFPHREGGAGAFVCVMRKDDAPASSASWTYSHGLSRHPKLEHARVPYIRADDAAGYFYETGGIVGYFSHERLPEILLKDGFQVGAPVFHKHRPHECMFGSILLPSPDAVIEVEEETAYAYIRGEELMLDHADGWYIIAFRGKLLGHVKVSGGKASNKLPRPFHIFM